MNRRNLPLLTTAPIIARSFFITVDVSFPPDVDREEAEIYAGYWSDAIYTDLHVQMNQAPMDVAALARATANWWADAIRYSAGTRELRYGVERLLIVLYSDFGQEGDVLASIEAVCGLVQMGDTCYRI